MNVWKEHDYRVGMMTSAEIHAVSQRRRSDVLALLEKGATYAVAAAAVGVSVSSVRNYAHDAGVSFWRQFMHLRPHHMIHGHAKKGQLTGTYVSWGRMLHRCRDPKNKHYAGRGITVCARWEKFENFLADMGERPAGLSIDRINNDGNYEPGNCRWADQSTQVKNRPPSKPRTHCSKGHPYNENESNRKGHHVCRICRRQYGREYRARVKR